MALSTHPDRHTSSRLIDSFRRLAGRLMVTYATTSCATATCATAVYLAIATLYLLFSEHLLAVISSDPDVLADLHMAKGLAFVAGTAAVLFTAWSKIETRERHARGQYEETRRRLGEISAALPNPLVILKPDGRLAEWNAANEAVLGYSFAELSTKSVGDLVHPDDVSEATVAIGGVVATGQPAKADVRLITADGRVLYYRWHGAPLYGADGSISDIAVVGVDMTDLKDTQERLRGALHGVKHVLKQTVDAIAMAVEKRDPYTAGHERRVALLGLEIGREMGLSQDACEGLEYGALLHDVGKLAVPTDILTRPGRLSDSELDVVKSHSEHGFDIVRSIDFPWPVADIVRQHHERLDGSGYPLGLKGDEICQEARIIGVADVVEAMCSHRPYRPGLGLDAALGELRAGAGTRYDAEVVRACETVIARGFDFHAAAA